MNKKSGLLATLRASSDWFIPTGAVALVFVMLVPLPSFMLDLLLTLSITASVLVLLTAIQILRPVQFSVFPSLILLLTLMRLALDLASTRRILLHGNAFMRHVDIPGLRGGSKLLQACIHRAQRKPDHYCRDADTDHQRYLLQARRCADQVAGL